MMTPVRLNPDQALQQAVVLHQQGRLADARQLYAEILKAEPDHFEALRLLGVLEFQQENYTETARLLATALAINPRSTDVLLNYGSALYALKRYAEALASFDRALALGPDDANAIYNCGTALQELGRLEEALASYDRALALSPEHFKSLFNRGKVLSSLGRDREALAGFDRALGIRTDHAETFTSRGDVLAKLDRHQEAVASFDEALSIEPNHVGALNNRGNSLFALGRYDEALASFDRALTVKPDYADGFSNRSNVLLALNRHQEALAYLDKALALDPDNARTQFNASLARLALGDFQEGWRQYEWRLKVKEVNPVVRKFSEPLWRGDQPLRGKTIYVYAEQGLGDTIHFVRYVPLVAKLGARVILKVQRPVKELLAGIEGVPAIESGQKPPSFDLHCPLLSLPLAFGTELGTIPANVPYLGVAADRIEKLKRRLPERKSPLVGLAWSGSRTHMSDRTRSLALARLAPLFSQPELQFVTLQRDVRDEDMKTLRDNPQIVHLDADFADTAAAMMSLDLVISVDTSLAHLAGALGKPVWILLSFSADFRWLLEREDSPWYPTARLFRQPKPGDWESVIERVRQELARLLHKRSPPSS